MSMTAREAAYKALMTHQKTGVWTNGALNGVLTRESLSDRESALASRLFYGVVQNLALCDFYIAAFSTVRVHKMQPQVLGILRLSVYQLVFLSKIPVNAAVNEGVKLAKKFANPRAAAFVNAVLRKISANLQHLPDVKGSTTIERLSILYSHPAWLVQTFADRLGLTETEALLKANNEPAVITARVNTVKADMEAVVTSLCGDGADAQPHPWMPGTLELRGAHRLDHYTAFRSGWLYVQDPASTLAVTTAEPRQDMFVLDGCAAPGGKSFTADVMMGDKGRVLSADISDKKIAYIQSGAERLGLSSIDTVCMDAREPYEELFGQADIVLADVPCSGLGVIRKKPEIRYKKPEDLAGLPTIQRQIIQNLSRYVRPGGTLIYSTCTVLERENEEVATSFLQTNNDFVPEAFSLPGPAGDAPSGMITLWPHRHGTDGFFICKLRRNA